VEIHEQDTSQLLLKNLWSKGKRQKSLEGGYLFGKGRTVIFEKEILALDGRTMKIGKSSKVVRKEEWSFLPHEGGKLDNISQRVCERQSPP